MTKTGSTVAGVMIVLGVGGGLAISAKAQAPAAAPADAVAALVTEVRALRTELSQLASASVRSQLLVTRIQLQEQRLMHLDRQRTDVGAKLRDVENARSMFTSQMQQLGGSASRNISAEERQRNDEILGGFKIQLETIQASEAKLKAEESTLLNAIATEQSRWNDFNNRLDELERSLPKASGR